YYIHPAPRKFLRVAVSLRPSRRVRYGSGRDCTAKRNVASMIRVVHAVVLESRALHLSGRFLRRDGRVTPAAADRHLAQLPSCTRLWPLRCGLSVPARFPKSSGRSKSLDPSPRSYPIARSPGRSVEGG